MEQHKQKCYVATLSFMSKTANKGGNIIVPVGGYFVFKGGLISDVLTYGYAGQLPWAHEHRAPMLIYACCVWQVFNCLNNDFVGRTIYILNCIDIYRFTPVSGCVGMGLSSLLFPGSYDAVKTAMNLQKHTSKWSNISRNAMLPH
jgi:hypothetical protein